MTGIDERHARVAQRLVCVDRNLCVIEGKLVRADLANKTASSLPWWAYFRRRRVLQLNRRILAEAEALRDVNARMQAKNQADLMASIRELMGAS
jgi:hypothetical protein